MAKTKNAASTRAAETKYSKPELLTLVVGAERTYFNLALKANLKYTWNEALKAVDNYKNGGLF